MDESSTSSLVGKPYYLPPCIPIEETFPRSLPRQWSDFRRSGPPIKFGLIADVGFFLHAKTPSSIMREAFASGKGIIVGKEMIYDFLRKVVIHLDDKGVPRVIGACYWVDADGFLFAPTLFGGVDESAVRRVFDGSSHGSLAITAVRRCHHREVRTLGFLERMKSRDEWTFGWYGAAAADVEAAADGGDLRMNWPLLGSHKAHGRGLHVSPQEHPNIGALLSSRGMDDRRTTHLLYCALALGWQEIVPAGSSQSNPSHTLFHTGTNALQKSSWHVIWESSVGTRVLPLFMVSYVPTGQHKRPGSPLEKTSGQKTQKVLQK
ncbi:unnamed protein product [Urochloa humidicola]